MTGLVGGPGVESPPPPDAGEFSKIWEIFPKKTAKIALFWSIYQKLSYSSVKISRVWMNNTIGWEILRHFLIKIQ